MKDLMDSIHTRDFIDNKIRIIGEFLNEGHINMNQYKKMLMDFGEEMEKDKIGSCYVISIGGDITSITFMYHMGRIQIKFE